MFKGKVLFAISHIQLVQNEPARNDAVINVRFQHVLSVHKRAVILTEITTCGGNCIPLGQMGVNTSKFAKVSCINPFYHFKVNDCVVCYAKSNT